MEGKLRKTLKENAVLEMKMPVRVLTWRGESLTIEHLLECVLIWVMKPYPGNISRLDSPLLCLNGVALGLYAFTIKIQYLSRFSTQIKIKFQIPNEVL